ncbi:MAG: DUF4157 domain-containing protein [Gemmatimonadaceae bacterium]
MFDRSSRNAPLDNSPAVARPTPTLTLGARHDAAEVDADNAAKAALGGTRNRATQSPASRLTSTTPSYASPSQREAPDSVHTALRSGGQPLDGSVRSNMEQRFDHRFSDVRVHDNAAAASSARDVQANAYTVGNRIAFAGGRYAPSTPGGQSLLAHELAHVVQNAEMSGPGVLRRQPAGSVADTPKTDAQLGTAQSGSTAGTPATPTPVAKRNDYVFIMGEDKKENPNKFYEAAELYYRAHLPGATFVTSIRNLADLLSWISTNVKTSIGNVYIVSHANEDGTLSFALDGAATKAKFSVADLRDALHPAGGASSLSNVSAQIDASTKIHIKGCDIGRTQEMIELIDEAFGGAGTVTAPTHEQNYNPDSTLRDRAAAQFKAGIEASHPTPPPVDTKLKGTDKKTATTQRAAAVKQRSADVQADLTARKAQGDALAEEAYETESFSGPMFQRPGTTLYTSAEMKPLVDQMYGHLSDKQRAALVAKLVAADQRSAGDANKQGTYQQQGQRAYKLSNTTQSFEEPTTAAEATTLYKDDFDAHDFKATGAPVITRVPASGGSTLSIEVPGRSSPKGQDAEDTTRTYTSSATIVDDATLIALGKTQVPNPARYAWRIARSHSASTGFTTLTVMGERVLAYLHHGSLDASAHQHFDAPESDPRFFATSTFAPPPPPAATAPTGTP